MQSPFQLQFPVSLLCFLIIGCGPSKLKQALTDLGISPVEVSGNAVLEYKSFFEVDTNRAEKILQLGVKALDAELKHVGTRRSAETSPGPVIMDNSYATHWNAYMKYLVNTAAEFGEPGSAFKLLAKDTELRSQGNILFSFAFKTRKPLRLKKIPVVLSNNDGVSVPYLEVGYETLQKNPYYKQSENVDKNAVQYLIEGRFIFPSHDTEANPLIHPEMEYMEITLLPGSAIHKFRFIVVKSNPPEGP